MKYIGINNYLNRKKEFWLKLQYHCVSECCGLDAYEFSEASIKDNLDRYTPLEINKDLEDMLSAIHIANAKYVSSIIFNCHLENKEFTKLIKDIKQVLLGVSV